MKTFGIKAALVSAVILAAPGASAQQNDDSGRTTIRGKIFDATTGYPLFGAFVVPDGQQTGFLTDSLGNFVLTMPNGAAFHLTANQLGYESVGLEILRMDAVRPIMIGMNPDPIMLEGVTTLVDRFQRRRSFFDGSVWAYDRDRLLTQGQGQDALQFVSSRSGMVRACYYDPLSYCVWRRGQLRRMQVCIDETLMFRGGRELEIYSPQDFYLIEVYDRGSQVRAYTTAYVERSVNRGIPLRPLSRGC